MPEKDYQTAEPFLEPIRKTTKAERQQYLEEAQYNAFRCARGMCM